MFARRCVLIIVRAQVFISNTYSRQGSCTGQTSFVKPESIIFQVITNDRETIIKKKNLKKNFKKKIKRAIVWITIFQELCTKRLQTSTTCSYIWCIRITVDLKRKEHSVLCIFFLRRVLYRFSKFSHVSSFDLFLVIRNNYTGALTCKPVISAVPRRTTSICRRRSWWRPSMRPECRCWVSSVALAPEEAVASSVCHASTRTWPWPASWSCDGGGRHHRRVRTRTCDSQYRTWWRRTGFFFFFLLAKNENRYRWTDWFGFHPLPETLGERRSGPLRVSYEVVGVHVFVTVVGRMFPGTTCVCQSTTRKNIENRNVNNESDVHVGKDSYGQRGPLL